MNRINKLFTLLLLLCSFTTYAQDQQGIPQTQLRALKTWQDSLKKLSIQMTRAEAEPERYTANYTFIKTLVSALKISSSIRFDFDSLKSISIVRSEDGHFRLFSWYIKNTDGSHRYYGTIQMNEPDGKLKLFPLVDYSPKIKNVSDTITTNEEWYGAQYYRIIPVTDNTLKPYYILLGWKGNTTKTTKKVIEVLYFKDNKAYFGLPIFSGNKQYMAKKRIIFEYSSQVTMMLNYLPEEKLIAFDHLAPMNPGSTGKPEYYGPDMTYNGFKLNKGLCEFVQDIPFKNAPSDKDKQFNAPKKGIPSERQR